ncbi:hypothetical protein NVV95_08520 [Herbiconiux sp. CPCC 205716]|uniref:Uncharacterized protein n=2 Tax=Herbiconiux gentiana TaxID=2970912 RepID=A0ABT2GEE7_9MICO|nr:hypothetical protein [Herbiconiux gentiana]MCS5714595.1 hypothetical protein [Herbiconiux gentiana]
MTEYEWFDVLNGRVFFWLHPNRLSELLQAKNYRHLEQDVITVDTAKLVARHRDAVRLSPINSGATLWPTSVERGSHTFKSIDDYDYAERRRGRSVQKAIAELAVVGGVPDVVDFTLRVDRYLGPQRLHTIFDIAHC